MEVILDIKDWRTELDMFGICGKFVVCATCRVNFVMGYDKLIPPAEDELDMLHSIGKSKYHENQTRLACQIRVTKTLEGAEIVVPREAFG